MSSIYLELSKQQKLLRMMEECGFTLCQQNGQRTYGGPPPNWGNRPPPSRDCEVFIGRIPRTCFEDELIPLFLSAGELYEFRLMLDFSGTNRGYAYAHYATLDGAAKAIKMLNKYEIRPGHYIGVLKSKNNCRLLFGNIRSNVTFESFSDFIRSATDHVLNVFLFKNFNELKMSDLNISLEIEEAFLNRMPRNNLHSQFAIVEYENHKAAAVARRVLIPKYGHIFSIDWAVPPRERKRNAAGSGASTASCGFSQTEDSRTSYPTATFSAKARPVPTLMARPSFFDKIPFIVKAFDNVVKYFKFLINESLRRSVQRAEIPLNVCKEMEQKIVERITNLENCGQAVQLIFNYLSWYNEKKPNTIDYDSQKVLQEVKMYSDSFVHFIFNKITYGVSGTPALEDYYFNILPLQLSFIFYMSLVLTGEEKEKLSGRITISLQWLNEIIEKIKHGNTSSQEFSEQVSRFVSEVNGTLVEKDNWTILKFLLAKNQLDLYKYESYSENALLNHQVITALRNNHIDAYSVPGSPVQTSLALLDEVAPEESIKSDLQGNINKSKSVKVLGEKFFPHQIKTNNSTSFNVQDLPSNWIVSDKKLYDARCGSFVDYDNLVTPDMHVGLVGSDEKFSDAEKKMEKSYSVPLLISRPSPSERVFYMHKTFHNVVKYFKYLINMNLRRSVQKAEIPFFAFKEIENKIVERIINLESCSKAIDLILHCISWYKGHNVNAADDDTEIILEEVKSYSDSFINYIYKKDAPGFSSNEDLKDYYCNILPIQISFLFHLVLILTDEEKERLSGRISSSLQWLNELIHKSKSGDFTLMEFFERISGMSLVETYYPLEKQDENKMKSILLKEAFRELNIISASSAHTANMDLNL